MTKYKNNTKETIPVIASKDSNGIPAWVYVNATEVIDLADEEYASKVGLSIVAETKPEIKAKPKLELKPKRKKLFS